MSGDRPTGAQLVEEMRAAAARAGAGVRAFVAPLYGYNAPGLLAQLANAKRPTPLTIERVRALCDGRPIPTLRGRQSLKGTIQEQTHRVTDGEIRIPGAIIAERRHLADLAHVHRFPGETLHAAINRLGSQQATISNLEGQ